MLELVLARLKLADVGLKREIAAVVGETDKLSNRQVKKIHIGQITDKLSNRQVKKIHTGQITDRLKDKQTKRQTS